jgi:hypothetical protein
MKTIEIIYKAINKINPDAQASMSGDDISALDTIVWHNGTPPISKEDIEAMIPIVEQELKDAEANALAKKASAKAKLAALGLDEEEINAIIGYN